MASPNVLRQQFSGPVSVDQLFKNAMDSIQVAESTMAKTRTSVDKAKTSKDGRSKVVAKASEMVNFLLEPAQQVAYLLDGIGGMFPPCKLASNTLAAIAKLEADRRNNDIRIVQVFMDISTTLVLLGYIQPGFQHATNLLGRLKIIIDQICDTMKEFGRFSEEFYESKAFKSKLKLYLFSNAYKATLAEFHDQITTHRANLTALLSAQNLLISTANRQSLMQLNKSIENLCGFFGTLTDDKEDQTQAFVARYGGNVEAIQYDEKLLSELSTALGEKLTAAVIKAVQESTDDVVRQSRASFLLKYEFALDQRIQDSQDLILDELKSGPYKLIRDPDVQEIWKNIGAKESSIKRRQLIDGMNYHFNIVFKTYKRDHGNADRDDAWTRQIISRVVYHSAIGDAIDDDASGFISVEEMNDFLRKKPENWTVPQWVAYWAYGWDRDNIFYQEKIGKAFQQLKKLAQGKMLNTELIKQYLDSTEQPVLAIANSVYELDGLDRMADSKMTKLQNEKRALEEASIKARLKSINYKIDYSIISAIAGSDREETTIMPLLSLLVTRDVTILGKANVTKEDVEEAITSIEILVDVVHSRIIELKSIWRRQRIDVDTQMRYYCNGLLEDYYKKYLMNETDAEDQYDSWDEDDQWQSGDEEEGNVVESTNASAVQQRAPSAQNVRIGTRESQSKIDSTQNIEQRNANTNNTTGRGIEDVANSGEEVAEDEAEDEDEGRDGEGGDDDGDDDDEHGHGEDDDNEDHDNEGDDDGGEDDDNARSVGGEEEDEGENDV